MSCKNVYIISDCITSLDKKTMTTSSQKFELDFSRALVPYFNVTIYTFGRNVGDVEEVNKLKLIGVSRDRKVYEKEIAEKIVNKKESVLIFYGYDLRRLLSYLRIKRRAKEIKVIPFIFDSHKPCVNSLKSKIKRFLLNVYFFIAKKIVKKFDGGIFFQEKAAKLLKIRNNYLVIKPMVQENDFFVHNNSFEDFNVVFAGSFTTLNCTDILLRAFTKLTNSKIRLKLFGSGPLQEMVNKYSDKYENIEYCGIVDDDSLQKVYKDSQLLLNLRDQKNEAMNFCFPSKLFEILNTGTPVLTSSLIKDEEFLKTVYSIDNISEDEIVKGILAVYSNYSYYCSLAYDAWQYIHKNYSNKMISERVFVYLNSICG